ncbi:hypothetical protein V8E55_012112 [Tylopilus felleus]
MSDDCSHPHEGIPDPLDDFLAQLLTDIPDLLPYPITTPSPPLSPPASDHALDPPLICQWVSTQEVPLICCATLPPDAKIACTHFRQAHDVRGNEKAIVGCQWYDCQVPPMQRGSLIRHVLSVHLRLLRWQCKACGKVLSRKGTGHACAHS